MARRIELLPRAVADLEALPPRTQDRIVAKLEMLREFPDLGVAMLDAFQGYRALLASKNEYRVVYRIRTQDLIEVAWIRHCARRPLKRKIRR